MKVIVIDWYLNNNRCIQYCLPKPQMTHILEDLTYKMEGQPPKKWVGWVPGIYKNNMHWMTLKGYAAVLLEFFVYLLSSWRRATLLEV